MMNTNTRFRAFGVAQNSLQESQTGTQSTLQLKNQSPSPENSSVTRGQDLQMRLCREASQIMFYSVKVFLAVKDEPHTHG